MSKTSKSAGDIEVSMKGLSHISLDPLWFVESRAFASDNPRVVRACMKMLAAAWMAEPAGSLPPDFMRLSGICGLTQDEMITHFEVLTEGWELRDERLFHLGMHALCRRIAEKHAPALQAFADQMPVLAQAPEDFALTAPVAEHSKLKGARLLPKDFALTSTLREWLSTKQEIPDLKDQEWILEKFVTHFNSTREKRPDWDASFRNFAMKENRRNLPSARNSVTFGQSTGGLLDRFKRFGTSGDVITERNLAAFEAHRNGAQR